MCRKGLTYGVNKSEAALPPRDRSWV